MYCNKLMSVTVHTHWEYPSINIHVSALISHRVCQLYIFLFCFFLGKGGGGKKGWGRKGRGGGEVKGCVLLSE